MNARMRVNRAVAQRYELTGESSNTLQSRDREPAEAFHARSLDATVEAIVQGTDPRLVRSRARP